MSATILWFRRNLRIADNGALAAAAATGDPVIPLYISDDLDAGGASRWWLHHSLTQLDQDLQQLGSRLVIRQGDPVAVIRDLVEQTGATTVCFARRYEPLAREQERRIEDLDKAGVHIHSQHDQLINPPDAVFTGSGAPYKVFTPFWKASRELGEPASPCAAPQSIRDGARALDSIPLSDLRLLPHKPDWAGGLRESWTPGEAGGLAQLKHAAEIAPDYAQLRDRPDRDSTSRLSPHLHFGDVSPRQAWHAIRQTGSGEALLRQLYWREFSAYLLYHYPTLPTEPLREEFEFFPWADDAQSLRAWQLGRTGFPLVDAGMRQLWHSGWMHNRVRMIVASFLVKDLMIPWQHGAEWFNDTLVDADLANNSASWQWVAGCGTDAAPYFRIFNPTTQLEKFDPDGAYVRRWIPELGSDDYPEPIVDHKAARERALAAYQTTRDLLKSRAGQSP